MKIDIKRVSSNSPDIIDKLVEIEKEAFGEGALNRWGLVPMIYHGKVYTILSDGEPIGIIEYMGDMDNLNKAYIFSLAIRSKFRGRGFASLLLDYTLNDLKKSGIKKVELTVPPGNRESIHIYKDKFSFKEVEYRDNEYGDGEDRLVMEMDI